MWAVLWNLWKINKQTKICKELNFTWATHNVNQWDINPIYHNAGITKTDNNEFQKGLYRNKKPPKDLNINLDLACSKYYELVKQIL